MTVYGEIFLKITSYTVIESRLVRRRIAPVEMLVMVVEVDDELLQFSC